jgi:Na+-translocating ferredoxin:NAD+ oxidoreductase RnfD subunit
MLHINGLKPASRNTTGLLAGLALVAVSADAHHFPLSFLSTFQAVTIASMFLALLNAQRSCTALP